MALLAALALAVPASAAEARPAKWSIPVGDNGGSTPSGFVKVVLRSSWT